MSAFDPDLTAEAADLLYREAGLLDRRDWRGWLALYTEDALFRAPALAGEDGFTADPDTEVSLLHLDRAGLEARVFRIESGDSWASAPLPMTVHLVTNVRVTGAEGAEVGAAASWLVWSFLRTAPPVVRAGLYDYALRRGAGGLTIAAKTVHVLDDRIVGPIDVFNV